MKLDVAIKDLQTERTRLEGQLKSVSAAIGLLTKLNTKSEPTTAAPSVKSAESPAAGAKPAAPAPLTVKSQGA
jgi:hypothetical protein